MNEKTEARINELLDQIADPKTPQYKVEELEQKIDTLRRVGEK